MRNRKKNIFWYSGCLLLCAAVTIYFLVFRSGQIGTVSYPDYPERPGLKVDFQLNSPSLLLITVDTLRPDYLSCNGHLLPTSSAIDRLMEKGICFTRALTPLPRTTQALASLLTGCYPHKTGVRYLWDRLSLEMTTLAEVLRKADYQTAAVVSNHIIPPMRGLDKGFDLYDFGSDKRDALKTTQAAMKHYRKFSSRRPFFLWVHYIDPHVPYYPPEKIAQRFDPGYSGKYETHFGGKPGAIGEEAYPEDIGKERAVFHNDLGERVNEHVRRLYAGDIWLTDRGIEVLLQKISEREHNDMLIVFTADHGESLGEHNYYYEHGAYVYNAAVRVPLAFVLPENKSGNVIRKIDDWVSLVDVFPSILEILGVRVQSGHKDLVDGRSLIPLWEGKATKSVPVFVESGCAFFPGSIRRRVTFDLAGRFRAVIYEDKKLIWTPFQQDGLLFELFDLAIDADETENVFALDDPKATALREILQDWMSQQKLVTGKSRPDEKDLEALRSLGYIK